MLRHSLILLLSLSACEAEAPKEGDTDVAGLDDSGDPCEPPASSWLTVNLTAADALAVGPEDLIWRSDTESGYCVGDDLAFRCDVTDGVIDLTVHVSGHRLVQESVEVPAPACDVEMPTLDLTLESLGPFFAEDHGYTIQLIEDDDECARSWELYSVNCHQTAIFCADGDSEVMVTDITWDGLYGLDEDAILGEYEGGEIPENLAFTVASDTEIVDSEWGWTWTLDATGVFASYVCREGGA